MSEWLVSSDPNFLEFQKVQLPKAKRNISIIKRKATFMYIKYKIATGNLEALEIFDKIINSSVILHSYMKTYFITKEPQLSRKIVTSVIK